MLPRITPTRLRSMPSVRAAAHACCPAWSNTCTDGSSCATKSGSRSSPSQRSVASSSSRHARVEYTRSGEGRVGANACCGGNAHRWSGTSRAMSRPRSRMGHKASAVVAPGSATPIPTIATLIVRYSTRLRTNAALRPASIVYSQSVSRAMSRPSSDTQSRSATAVCSDRRVTRAPIFAPASGNGANWR